MIEINLREFYPECYRSDYFVEVPDEVAELLILLRRHEQSQRRRIYKYKAQYSLDIYENVERETVLKCPSAEEVFEQLAEQEQLYDAMMALTHKQRTRLYAYFFLNMSYSKIAKQEGVDATSVRESIQRAIRQLQKRIHLF
ncbi:MAG: sigma-70 family RNA polymerase sigma factor [Clostridia bacterium]|nr:sigma-70 family RNA polymerase sigma factor [Clostridia bacterium]